MSVRVLLRNVGALRPRHVTPYMWRAVVPQAICTGVPHTLVPPSFEHNIARYFVTSGSPWISKPVSGHQRRSMYTDLSALPGVDDPEVAEALNILVANPWLEIEHDVAAKMERVLATSSDKSSTAILQTAWSAAQAVEMFGDRLEQLRTAVSELSGGKFGGETVAAIPDPLRAALETSLHKYEAYLASFSDSETWLKKKVELELGGSLLTVKQRCSGMGTAWSQFSLLGTSGLAGSYVERRAGLSK